MSNAYEVSEIGEHWGRAVHRGLKIERCSNGYIVKYRTVAHLQKELHSPTTERQRVFITNSDMLEFVAEYFSGEPKP